MINKVSTDRNKSLIITLFLMLLLMLLFLLPVFKIVHPTPTEKELQMVDLSAGFSVNNETGGGSKPKKNTNPTPTPPKQQPVTETPVKDVTPPKSIETQQTESPIETTPPKPVETPTPDPEPEKALYSFDNSDSDNTTTETNNQDTRTTSGGRGIGSGRGDGNGEGENGYGGIGLGGALSGRKIINPSSPRANCPLNKTEVVVLNVRVNSEGTVTFAEPNYTKSLTSNKCLLDFSVDYAKKLKWNKSSISQQSGTIQFSFKP